MERKINHNYQDYKAADFALDPAFIEWVKHPEGDQSDFWTQWCVRHPEKQEEVETASIMVRAFQFDQEHVSQAALTESWEELRDGLRSGGKTVAHRKGRPGSGAFRMAAVLLLTICFTFVLSRLNSILPDQPGQSSTVRKEALKGQKLTVVLPDGSVVKLNSESSIQYPVDFAGDVREVTLEGEAFFEVVHNALKPFMVSAGDITTVVMGTAFNVRSYPESSVVQIALAEGRVKVVSNTDTAEDSELVLQPGEMLTASKNDRDASITEFDEEDILGWKEGLLNFSKVSFADALKTMERWYGVEFMIDEKVSIDPEWRFHGKFKNRSLAYILGAMRYPDLFKFKIKGSKVLIY